MMSLVNSFINKLYFFHRYRRRRSYSTRSDTNNSVFNKNTEVPKHSASKQPPATVIKNSDLKAKHKRAKSTSSQQNRSSSVSKHNNQNDQKDRRSSSKRPNKRRTKSESAKTITSPPGVSNTKSSNSIKTISPSIDTPKNKRRSRQKPCQRIHSDDLDKQPTFQSNTKFNDNNKHNSRSNSRVTRRDFVDHQEHSREMSFGRITRREYLPSPKKYYSQSRRQSFSQERLPRSNFRSNSRVHDSNRSVMQQNNRYSNGPTVHQSRYFNGSVVRHGSFNGPLPHQNNNKSHIIRHNSYTNDPLPQNTFYDGIITRRNSYSKGSTIRQNGYTSSRIFRPPQYRNGMVLQNNEVKYFICLIN